MEGSGESPKCECPESGMLNITTTAAAPDEDCLKRCQAEKSTTPAKTTDTTTVAIAAAPPMISGCCCCNEEPTTTTSTTTTTQAPRRPCCCCRGRESDCRRPQQSATAMDPGTCPSGWTRFQQSCYFMENKKMSLMDAQKSCAEKGGSLFVADSVEEFNEVMKKTTPFYWSWIGLGLSEINTQPKWGFVGPFDPSTMRCLPLDSSNQPSWGGSDGVDPSRLKWLINPFSPIPNGYSPAATCVGYFNGDVYASNLYFYPCSLHFYSVCERNFTLI